MLFIVPLAEAEWQFISRKNIFNSKFKRQADFSQMIYFSKRACKFALFARLCVRVILERCECHNDFQVNASQNCVEKCDNFRVC